MKNLKMFSLLLLGLVITFTSCEPEDENQNTECPPLFFQQDGKKLIADFEGINDLNVYEWFVNDQLVETESQQNERDNALDLSSYNPGTYKVCLKAETDDCPGGTEFCKEITVEEEMEGCPDLKYTREGAYLIANFEGIEVLEFYAWKITGENLGNESIIENEGTNNQGDNKYSLNNLEAGIYTICLISESATCTSTEFCKEITIEGDEQGVCPDLSFIVEGTTLIANFAGLDQLEVYQWFLDGQLIETEDAQSQDRDNELDMSSFNPGTYTVCIMAETNDCPNGAEFCKEVVIPASEPVDCSMFKLEYLTTNTAEFVNANGVGQFGVDDNSVVWQINGNQVTPTSATGHFIILKDHISQPGNYEVCYKASSTECGNLETCIEIDFVGL